MEAKRSQKRWTYEEFVRLPSETSTRYEIIDGELVVTPSPGTVHQRVVGKLVGALGNFVDEHRLGEVLPGSIDVLFAEGDYLAPDLVFVRADRSYLVSKRGIEGPPDLVVEILSPSTSKRDRGIKLDRYRHFGVGEYWIVDADAGRVEVWRLASGAESAEVFRAGERLDWTPVGEGPTLDLEVDRIVAPRVDFDRLRKDLDAVVDPRIDPGSSDDD